MNPLLALQQHSTYNPAVGLWRRQYPGHTAPTANCAYTHSGPDSASLLVVAAQLEVLPEIPVTRILEALVTLQDTGSSERHGCFRWYAEDPGVVDTNAAFFIGLNLIVLHRAYVGQLTPDDQHRLERMLARLQVWFTREVHSKLRHYPNKFIGDLTCLWLLQEIAGETTAWLKEELAASADYYLRSPWGWGEHLSDPYTTIMLDELSALLLLARSLPSPIHQACREMLASLLAIEDFFSGGPRVPTIRTYAFQQASPHRNYRESVRRWDSFEDFVHNPEELTHLLKFNFGHLFQTLGWHQLAPEKPSLPLPRTRNIPCFNNHHATAFVARDFRFGTMSQYPIMPNCDHPKWGLSWQTMPLAFLVCEKQWGFWRWSARENGTTRAHPAFDKATAYLHNTLSDEVTPAIAGETHARQQEHTALVLRRMPILSRQWDWLADGLNLMNWDGQAQASVCTNGWHLLQLHFNGGPSLAIWFHPLATGLRPELSQENQILKWEFKWNPAELGQLQQISVLWALNFSAASKPPELRPLHEPVEVPRIAEFGNTAWSLAWDALPDHRFQVDPIASNPLIQIKESDQLPDVR